MKEELELRINTLNEQEQFWLTQIENAKAQLYATQGGRNMAQSLLDKLKEEEEKTNGETESTTNSVPLA